MLRPASNIQVPFMQPQFRRGRYVAPAGGETPSTMGMQLWLKADSQPYSDGNTVTTATDSSPAGNNSSGAPGPTYKTNIINGKPVLRFDGVDDVLIGMSAALTDTASWTLFSVVNQKSAGHAYFCAQTNNHVGFTMGGDASSGGGGVGMLFGAVAWVTQGSASLNTWAIQSGARSSGTANVYTNGALIRTTTTSPTSDGSIYRVGRIGPPYIQCDIAEIICYSRSLGASERQAVEDYLSAKYGIPVTH